MDLQAALRAARERADLTQAEAGAQIGVSKQTVWNWEHGRTTPKRFHVMALCWVYAQGGVNVTELAMFTKSSQSRND